MICWTGKAACRAETIALGLASVVVAGISCYQDNIAEPSVPNVAEPPSPAATATTALLFYQLSGGEAGFTCGVTPDYRAYCWGQNHNGQIGDGTTYTGPSTARLTPVAVATTLRFQQVSAGWSHACGLAQDNRAYCWGSNGVGALGDGTMNDHYTPVAVAGGLHFKQLDAGSDYTCGVTFSDNRAYCWGNNWAGQLGDGTTSPRLRPRLVVGGLYFKHVRTGTFHACGITMSNRAYCWGFNQYGELGDSTTVTRLRPTRVAAGTRRFRQVDAAGAHSCAVSTLDRAFCWGYGRNGALGIGKAWLSYWPRAVVGGLYFERVTTGNGHTCGEATGNRTYCWGYNGYGQLGDGTTTTRLTPVPVAGGLFFAQVTAGGSHTCGKTSEGVAYCWGDKLLGAVGDGTWQNTRDTPVPVAGLN
jgi:alpha-tubulin suppressor-like RCC1 family protein